MPRLSYNGLIDRNFQAHTLARGTSRSTPGDDRAAGNLLLIYLAVLIGLTACALLVMGTRRYILHLPFPKNTLLFSTGSNRFSDFTDISARVAHFGERDMLSRTDFPTPFAYPVACVYVLLIFVRLFPNPLHAYLIFMLAAFMGVAYAFQRRLNQLGKQGVLYGAVVWTTLFTSYPALYMFDRGNIEGIVWLFIVFGTVCFVRGHLRFAALLFAIATAMKLFPAIFFALFVAKKRYPELFLGGAITAVLMAAALAGIGPTFTQALHDSSLSVPFLNSYIIKIRFAEAGFDHSLWGSLKQLAYLFIRNEDVLNSALPRALKIYVGILTAAGIPVYWFYVRHLPLLNQFIIFVLLCGLIPFVSYEYHLIQVYIAWAAFVIFLLQDVGKGAAPVSYGTLLACLVSFAVLFTPQSYLFVNGHGVGGQIKTMALLAIGAIMVSSPMRSRLFGDL